jgi:hypothetical protein
LIIDYFFGAGKIPFSKTGIIIESRIIFDVIICQNGTKSSAQEQKSKSSQERNCLLLVHL